MPEPSPIRLLPPLAGAPRRCAALIAEGGADCPTPPRWRLALLTGDGEWDVCHAHALAALHDVDDNYAHGQPFTVRYLP